MDSQCYDTHCNASYIVIKVEVDSLHHINEIAPKYSLAHSRRMFPYPVQKEADALTEALSGAGLR